MVVGWDILTSAGKIFPNMIKSIEGGKFIFVSSYIGFFLNITLLWVFKKHFGAP